MNIDKIIKKVNAYFNIATKFNLLKVSNSYCAISLEEYEKSLLKYLLDIADHSIEKFENAKNISYDEIISELNSNNIKNVELLKLIEEKSDDVFYKLKELRDGGEKLSASLCSKIIDYCSSSDTPYTEEDAQEDFKRILEKTKENMNNICIFLNDAISRIENYQGTNWIVTPNVSYSYSQIDKLDYSEPCDSVTITSALTDAIYFSLFNLDNKLTPEDVIDDEMDIEFSGWQSDYYKLINEIRSPGSTSTGKEITLYTARPTEDRELYLDAKNLPNNLYLTNSINSAEGIAIELAGKDKSRDVWKVRINTKYLLKTLDNGIVKEYRVIAGEGGAPIKYMELIGFGDSGKQL
jgi:hypothetical protein